MMPSEVFQAAMQIATILDNMYGSCRDIDNDDGGFVLVAQNIQDISQISERYFDLRGNRHEVVDIVKCESGTYLNAFFLCNNEFGVNIFIPKDIAPQALLKDLPKSGNVRKEIC
jgi:hypothetical protein